MRLYVAPMYGYKSLKWLDRVEVVDALDDPTDPGYWERNGYDVDAWVGQVQRPRRRAHLIDRAPRTPNDQLVGDRVVRFSRAERWLHWTNATPLPRAAHHRDDPLPPVAVGRRRPAVAGEGRARLQRAAPARCRCSSPTPGRWRESVRRDVRRFARWSTDDRRWLLSLGRRGKDRLGKFNAGQKLNAIFVAGCIPLMLATGGIMRWFDPFPLAWRTGATFVHDWIALMLLVVVVGHIVKALAEPIALRAMARGTVPARHVERRHPRWWAEVRGSAAPPIE